MFFKAGQGGSQRSPYQKQQSWSVRPPTQIYKMRCCLAGGESAAVHDGRLQVQVAIVCLQP